MKNVILALAALLSVHAFADTGDIKLKNLPVAAEYIVTPLSAEDGKSNKDMFDGAVSRNHAKARAALEELLKYVTGTLNRQVIQSECSETKTFTNREIENSDEGFIHNGAESTCSVSFL